MKFESRRVIINAIAVSFVLLLGFTSANGQAAPQEKPQMADDIFKNVQVLRGLTAVSYTHLTLPTICSV